MNAQDYDSLSVREKSFTTLLHRPGNDPYRDSVDSAIQHGTLLQVD